MLIFQGFCTYEVVKVQFWVQKRRPLRRRPGDDIIQVHKLDYIWPEDWQEKIYVRGRSVLVTLSGLLLFMFFWKNW